MERPSHIIFDTHHFSRRLPIIGVALSLQLAGVWLFTHGLMSRMMHFDPGPIEVVQVPDTDKPPIKPPEPNIPTTVKKEAALEPIFKPEKTTGGNLIPQPPSNTNDPLQPRGLDRALAAIPGTHTVPPYPPIAQRIGAEGKVTLRLTVSAEGKVTAAEVVSSSGRDDMDQSARQWIVAHWAYRPALDNGVPVIGHVLATVTFNLIDAR